jgi:hypothetical protein
MLKIRGGHLKRNIEIQAGEWDYVEVPCREDSSMSISASEIDGDTFNVYIVPSNSVKKAPLLETVMEYYTDGIVWEQKKVSYVDDVYIHPYRDTIFIIFDNSHAKSKYKSIDIDISVVHPPLVVGDEPLTESFEVDAKSEEVIDVDVNSGDTIRVFGRVTKGKDITVHILSKLYETPDTYHLDKAYFTKEKVGEIEIEYHCTKTEPLLIIFDNAYSLRTTKTVDVSVQVIRGVAVTPPGKAVSLWWEALKKEEEFSSGKLPS